MSDTEPEADYSIDLFPLSPPSRLKVMRRQLPRCVSDAKYINDGGGHLLVTYPQIDPVMRHILELKKYRQDVWNMCLMLYEDPDPEYAFPEIPKEPARVQTPMLDQRWMLTRHTLRESAEQCCRIMLQARGFTHVTDGAIREFGGRLSGLMAQLCNDWKLKFDPEEPGAGFEKVLKMNRFTGEFHSLLDHIKSQRKRQQQKLEKCKRLWSREAFEEDLQKKYEKIKKRAALAASGRLKRMSSASESSDPGRSASLPRQLFSDDGNRTSSPDMSHGMAADSSSSSEHLGPGVGAASVSSGADSKRASEGPSTSLGTASGTSLSLFLSPASDVITEESSPSDTSSPSAEGTTGPSSPSVIEVPGFRLTSSSSSELMAEGSSKSDSSGTGVTTGSSSPSVIEVPGFERLAGGVSESDWSGSGQKRDSSSSSRSEMVPNVTLGSGGSSSSEKKTDDSSASDSSGSDGKKGDKESSAASVKKKAPGVPQGPSTSAEKKPSGSRGAGEKKESKESRSDSPMDTGSDPDGGPASPPGIEVVPGPSSGPGSSGVTSGKKATVESSKPSGTDKSHSSSEAEGTTSGSTETSGSSGKTGSGSSSKTSSGSAKQASSGSSKMEVDSVKTKSDSPMDYSSFKLSSCSAMDTGSDNTGYVADSSSAMDVVSEETEPDSPPSSAGLLPRDPSPFPHALPPKPPTPDYPPSPGFSLNPPSRLPVVEDVPEEPEADESDESSV